MILKFVTVLFISFVTLAGSNKSGEEDRFIASREIETCDVFPQMKCSSDCLSLTICYDESAAPLRLKCPADRPYCANGKCGTVKENCVTKTAGDANVQSFECTSDGTFPDPTNCTNSYVCDGGTATQSSCSAGNIFDSKTNECVRGNPRIDHASKKICRKISCDNKQKGYILFPANPAFYAYCSDGSITLYKCSDVQNQVFDIASNKCVFNCRTAGYFPDPSNCSVYYFCKGLIKFKVSTLYCAVGHYFDGTKCVNGMNCGSTTTQPTPPTQTPTTDPPQTPPTQTPPTQTSPTQTLPTQTLPTQTPTTDPTQTSPTDPTETQPTDPTQTPPTDSTQTPSTEQTQPPTTDAMQTPPTQTPPTQTPPTQTTPTSPPQTPSTDPTQTPPTAPTQTPIPTPPTAPTTEPPSTTESTTTTTTTEPPSTEISTENLTTTSQNPSTTSENPSNTSENPSTTSESPSTTSENTSTTSENTSTTSENPTITSENTSSTSENPSSFSSIPFWMTAPTVTKTSSTTTKITTESTTTTTTTVKPFTNTTTNISLLPALDAAVPSSVATHRGPTKSPITLLWKHKGKYSVRLS